MSTMIGYPLAPVVGFLCARGALDVLDGAPFYYSNGPLNPPMQPVPADKLETWSGEPVRLLGAEHHATLYLGTSDLCPAAEGWVSRVLALAYDELATHIDFSSLSVAELMRRDRLLVRWIWHDYPPRVRTFRETPIIGAPPPTPAARVAAVLNHELKRNAP